MDKRCIVVVIALMFLTGIDTCLRRASEDRSDFRPSKPATTKPSKPADEEKLWQCGLCGSPIDVTLHLENNLKEPYFNSSILLEGVNQQELFHILLQAANRNDIFRFSMTHFGAELGLMVDSINGLKTEAVGKRFNYWRILYGNGTALVVGVSTYVPQDKEEIIFRYTTSRPYN